MGRKMRDGVEMMARTGFVAKGIVYLLLGLLAGRAAFGPKPVGSTETVLIEVLQAPFGRLLLAVLALGLAWYAAWRFIEAGADANDKGTEPKGLAARGIYTVSGLIYATLALDAMAILLQWDNDSGQVRSFAATLLRGPLSLVAGLGVAAYGLYQVWKGIVGKLSGQLKEGKARREAGPWVIVLSRIGLAGRGLVFVTLGYWLFTHPSAGPSMASGDGGTSGALRLLSRLPQGDTFLVAAAGALMAYGAYQLVHSRYRRINVP
ncbi:MAG TPA: DUF1206 domain-containing protein [Vicinamibacterales bacterium]